MRQKECLRLAKCGYISKNNLTIKPGYYEIDIYCNFSLKNRKVCSFCEGWSRLHRAPGKDRMNSTKPQEGVLHLCCSIAQA